VLNYFNGDTNKAIKAFFNDSIELPLNHPITTYKYSGTTKMFNKKISCTKDLLLVFIMNRNRCLDAKRDKNVRECLAKKRQSFLRDFK
jgi:hypothetical protein